MRRGCVGALLTLACHGPPAGLVDAAASDGASDEAPGPCVGAAGFAACVFHFADTDNDGDDDRKFVSLFVANPGERSLSVAVEQRGQDGRWARREGAQIPAAGATLLRLGEPMGSPLDAHIEGDGPGRRLALRLVTDAPVLAALWNSDALTGDARSSSATLLVPTAALGLEYRAVAPPSGGLLSVIATRDGTQVTIEEPGSGVHNATLDEGDLYQVDTAAAEATGLRVLADAPVAVLAGATCATLDPPAGGFASGCDKVEEMLLPVSAWGRTFAVAPLPPRDEACAARQPGPFTTIVRVVAAQADTTLAFDPAPGSTGLPGTARLAAPGSWAQYETEGGFLLEASRPVEVAQLVRCEPALALVPPLERWTDSSHFLAPGLIRESAVLVRKIGAEIRLDGQLLPAGSFVPIGAGFEAATVVLPGCGLHRLGPRPGDLSACVHRLTGAPAIASVVATDFLAGYALSGSYRLDM